MKLLLFMSLWILISSCSTPEVTGSTQAEVLFKEAQRLVKKNRFILATEKLNGIKSQFPYSYYATHAELLLADILFMQQNYVESAAAYILFRDFHPKHEKLPYVIWKVALSYYKQLPSSFDRDLAPGDEALKYLNEVISRYPNSDHFVEAKEKIDEINKMKVDKELYVADFYFKTNVFDSARFRYLEIISKHLKNDEAKSHAMLRALESSVRLKEYKRCLEDSKKFKESAWGDLKQEVSRYESKCQKKS